MQGHTRMEGPRRETQSGAVYVFYNVSQIYLHRPTNRATYLSGTTQGLLLTPRCFALMIYFFPASSHSAIVIIIKPGSRQGYWGGHRARYARHVQIRLPTS